MTRIKQTGWPVVRAPCRVCPTSEAEIEADQQGWWSWDGSIPKDTHRLVMRRSEPQLILDGVVMNVGDRVLITTFGGGAETNTANNGIWVVDKLPAPDPQDWDDDWFAPAEFVRPPDYSEFHLHVTQGQRIAVLEGVQNAGSLWEITYWDYDPDEYPDEYEEYPPALGQTGLACERVKPFLNVVADAIRFMKQTTALIPAGALPSQIESIAVPATPIVNQSFTQVEHLLTAVANSIRTAAGTTDPIPAMEFPNAIYHIGVWDGGTGGVDPDHPFQGSGTLLDPWLIETAAQFAFLHECVVDDDLAPIYNVHGAHYKIVNDLQFNSLADYVDEQSYWGYSMWYPQHSFRPIGNIDGWNVKHFRGNLDGDNHTLSGLYINEGPQWGFGIFCYLDGGTIKNLRVSHSHIMNYTSYQGGGTGGIVGICHSSTIQLRPNIIDNCHFRGQLRGFMHVGGIVGEANGAQITNCTVVATIASHHPYFGGIVGIIAGGYRDASNTFADAWIRNCISEVMLLGYSWNANQFAAGGIAGSMSNATIENCQSLAHPPMEGYPGTINGKNNVGGIVGLAIREGNRINNCTNAANVYGDSNVGGLIGAVEPTTATPLAVELTNCVNSGRIVGGGRTGGFTGAVRSPNNQPVTCKMFNCYNTGRVIGWDPTGGMIGDIVGVRLATTLLRMINCYNAGDVQLAGQYWEGHTVIVIGGMVGMAYTMQNPNSLMRNCYTSATMLPGGSSYEDYDPDWDSLLSPRTGLIFGMFVGQETGGAQLYFLRTPSINTLPGNVPIPAIGENLNLEPPAPVNLTLPRDKMIQDSYMWWVERDPPHGGGGVIPGPWIFPAPTTPATTQWTMTSNPSGGNGSTGVWSKASGGTVNQLYLAYHVGDNNYPWSGSWGNATIPAPQVMNGFQFQIHVVRSNANFLVILRRHSMGNTAGQQVIIDANDPLDCVKQITINIGNAGGSGVGNGNHEGKLWIIVVPGDQWGGVATQTGTVQIKSTTMRAALLPTPHPDLFAFNAATPPLVAGTFDTLRDRLNAWRVANPNTPPDPALRQWQDGPTSPPYPVFVP